MPHSVRATSTISLLLKVMTDDEGKATIPSTVTREIRLFGEDSAIGKMVVLESSSKGEVEGCGVIVRKEGPVDISIIIVVLAVVIAILLCFVIGLCVYCCKKWVQWMFQLHCGASTLLSYFVEHF